MKKNIKDPKPVTKSKRGGYRPGAGKKMKYGERTDMIGFRVPSSKRVEIIKKIEDILKPYEKSITCG